ESGFAARRQTPRCRQERMMRCDRELQRVWSAALPHTVGGPVIAVVMGVSGSGKTTVSALLAAALGCQFQEGDDLHPTKNVEKMQSGTPLTDADRLPWLRKIAEEIDAWRARHESGVLTCSALKRSYRDIIIDGRSDVTLVYLKGSYTLSTGAWWLVMDISCRWPSSIANLQHCRNPRRMSIRSSSMSVAGRPKSLRRSSTSSRSCTAMTAVLNLHRDQWRARKPHQESDNDTAGQRDS